MERLSISRVFVMRSVCPKWKRYVDENTLYWRRMASLLLPMNHNDAVVRMCAIFSLNGINDGDLEAMFSLFKSEDRRYRYLVRNIINDYLGRPVAGVSRVTPAMQMQHPGAQGDPESYSLIYVTSPPQMRIEFFFCRGQTILYRKGNSGALAWKTVRVTELVGPYLRAVNHGI